MIEGDIVSVVATLEGLVDPLLSLMTVWFIYILLFYIFKMISGRKPLG